MSLNKKYLTILFLSGILAAASSPGFNIWFMAWIAFIPLLVIIAIENSHSKSLIYSFVFGFCYYLGALSWFSGLFPLYWLGLSTIQSILLITFVLLFISIYQAMYVCIFGLVASIIFRKLQVAKTVLIPLAWVFVVEVIASKGEFAFPWAMIQYSQYKILTLIQICQFVGGIGLGFLILLFNTACALLILDLIKFKQSSPETDKPFSLNDVIKNPKFKLHAISLGIIALTLILINLYGYERISHHKDNATIAASVTQASFPVEFFRSDIISDKQEFMTYLELILASPNGIIVLPEGAISTYLRDKSNTNFVEGLKSVASMKNSTIVIGVQDKINDGDTNAVLAISPNSPSTEKIPVYHKEILVPFGEYTPFGNILPSLNEDITPSKTNKDFVRGKNNHPLETKFGRVGALVCYEAILPNMFRKLVLDGAEILINVSNLGWYHNSFIHEQFIAICVFRAVENDRYMLVAINNGSSAIIDPYGKILAITPKNIKTFVSAKIEPRTSLTVFTKLGI